MNSLRWRYKQLFSKSTLTLVVHPYTRGTNSCFINQLPTLEYDSVLVVQAGCFLNQLPVLKVQTAALKELPTLEVQTVAFLSHPYAGGTQTVAHISTPYVGSINSLLSKSTPIVVLHPYAGATPYAGSNDAANQSSIMKKENFYKAYCTLVVHYCHVTDGSQIRFQIWNWRSTGSSVAPDILLSLVAANS